MSIVSPGQTHSGASALEWNDLNVILAICRAGSLSGAARIVGQTHSTVFRKINAIEEKTGVRFFERLPHGYAMTEAGETALRYAERVESEMLALGREVLGQDMRLQGKIRVTAPVAMAERQLPQVFADFHALHPEVSVEIVAGTPALDLARREADLAIRATRKPPDDSLAKKVCDFRFALYAAPAFLEAHGKKPVSEHEWCLLRGVEEWLVPMIWKKTTDAAKQVVFASDSTQGVLNAAAVGLGLTVLPCYVGDADSRVVRASAPIEKLTLHLWILTHPDLRHTARVKALREFTHGALSSEADLFAGERPQSAKVWYEKPF